MSAEQSARNILERLGVEDAQTFTADDLVELANLIAERDRLHQVLDDIRLLGIEAGASGQQLGLIASKTLADLAIDKLAMSGF